MFQLFDHFRHGWAIVWIMSPHPLEEVNNFGTPLFPQARNRRSERYISSVFTTFES